MPDSAEAVRAEQLVTEFISDISNLTAEIGKVIVGQDLIVKGALSCLLAGGHALLEGVLVLLNDSFSGKSVRQIPNPAIERLFRGGTSADRPLVPLMGVW